MWVACWQELSRGVRNYCASWWVRSTDLFGISELKNGLISQRTGRNLDEYAGIEVVRWEQFA
jgi:hypothetical protein